MSLVESAIQGGRCSLAISGDLLRDENVMLALKERGSLSPMALSGPPVAPVVAVGPAGVARASGNHGVLVIVEPGEADTGGLQKLAELVRQGGGKPTVCVVGQRYNQLQMMSLFRGLKLEHIKERGKTWVAGLPLPQADEASAAVASAADAEAKAAKKQADAGPRFVFVGREDEVAELTGLLGQGGPIVVSGPTGVGKTAILEHAIEAARLTRLPDLALGRGVGADALFARIAAVARAGGADGLYEVLKRPHTPIEAVEEALRSLQAAAGTEGQVMVVEGLHLAAGREGDFFRKSRLELLCEALLTQTYPLRLVFTSLVQPVFYREGRDAPLRRLRVEGVKGRFYYDIFQAMGAPEFPRDRFGPMSEKLHGHALAIRTAAVAIRHAPALVDNEKFFRMEDISDVEEVKKQLEKRIERLPDAQRDLLGRISHLRYPVDATLLSDIGVSRKDRMYLVAEGLLDMVGTEQNKRYQVHTLVRSALPTRASSDFETFEEIGKRLAQLANAMDGATDGVAKLALQQEANRCFIEARRFNLLIELDVPDYDGIAESCLGLIRSKTPRFDMAAQRIAELLRRDPGNADAHLLRLELLRRQDSKNDAAQQAVQEALDQAPVPEVYHEAVAFFLARNARNKAIKVLEGAVEALPEISRLRTRLASLLLRQGRRPEAIDHLKRAMDQDPMLPDAYGLLGMARREEGADSLEEAENLLREAVRLAPHDVVQTSRLVWLLLDIARGVPERAAVVRAEVRTLLDNLLLHDKKSWEAHLLYAVALREEGAENLDRARWFLKQARRLAPPKGGPTGRFDVEEALQELAEGKLDEAETRLRRLEKKDPSNHRVFSALAHVLEQRGQLFAAHAELVRAADRTAPTSLDRQAYDVELARLRALIEASAGVMMPAAAEPAPEPSGDGEVAAEAVAEDAGETEAPSAFEDVEPEQAEEASGEEAPSEEAPSDPSWDV